MLESHSRDLDFHAVKIIDMLPPKAQKSAKKKIIDTPAPQSAKIVAQDCQRASHPLKGCATFGSWGARADGRSAGEAVHRVCESHAGRRPAMMVVRWARGARARALHPAGLLCSPALAGAARRGGAAVLIAGRSQGAPQSSERA